MCRDGSANRRIALVGIGLLLTAPITANGQALEELRDDVRTSMPGESADRIPPREPDHREDTGDSDDDSNWGLGLIFAALAAPFWGPPVAMGDDYSERGYFAHFPHQYDEGYMLIGELTDEEQAESRAAHSWAARGRAEFGTDFDALQWIGGHVLVEASPRWGLECDFRHVRESRDAVKTVTRTPAPFVNQFDPNRDPYGADPPILIAPTPTTEEIGYTTGDSLWVGDANLLFRFAQSKWLVMRTGLGANFLSDPRGSDFGFNFTYGGDFFPIRPWVLSGELDLGTLGHTNLYHFRGTIGANWRSAEAYVGYDYYDIGPTQVAGLVAGVRLWY